MSINMIENEIITEEEKLIQQIIDFQEAWDKGDAKIVSGFFTEDVRRVGSFGETQNSRSEVEAAYKMLLNRAMPGSKLLFTDKKIRFLNDELAIWQANSEILVPDKLSNIKGYTVMIMKKENDKWMILEMHPKIFPLQDQASLVTI
jgi:uncharacterized protein (TIGR02246 family)